MGQLSLYYQLSVEFLHSFFVQFIFEALLFSGTKINELYSSDAMPLFGNDGEVNPFVETEYRLYHPRFLAHEDMTWTPEIIFYLGLLNLIFSGMVVTIFFIKKVIMYSLRNLVGLPRTLPNLPQNPSQNPLEPLHPLKHIRLPYC